MFRIIITSLLVSLIVSTGVGYGFMMHFEKPPELLIEDYYATENAVMISPHGLRKKMMEGVEDFVLVDLRSEEEYKKVHIRSAVNIPAYISPDKSAYDEEDRIVSSFQALIQENPGKDIIVYCYSSACMTGRKMGKMLTKHDIYVKHLGIGWNEWRYSWNLWNHDGEIPSSVEDYLSTGSDPIPKIENPFGCSAGGGFDC